MVGWLNVQFAGWTAVVAAVIVAGGLALVTWLLVTHTVNVKFGPMMMETHKAVKEINKAVNNVPAGAPTLVTRVQRLERSQQWQCDAVGAIADHVGVDLPDRPK